MSTPIDEDVKIYILIDPLDGIVRYVGSTINVESRYYEHCNYDMEPMSPKTRESRIKITGDKSWYSTKSKKFIWLRELYFMGMKPIIQVVAVVDFESRFYWEGFFFEVYKNPLITNTVPIDKNRIGKPKPKSARRDKFLASLNQLRIAS